MDSFIRPSCGVASLKEYHRRGISKVSLCGVVAGMQVAVLVSVRHVAASCYFVLIETVTADATDVILRKRFGGVIPASLIFFCTILISISIPIFRSLLQKFAYFA
jgi:hypothetical protein